MLQATRVECFWPQLNSSCKGLSPFFRMVSSLLGAALGALAALRPHSAAFIAGLVGGLARRKALQHPGPAGVGSGWGARGLG